MKRFLYLVLSVILVAGVSLAKEKDKKKDPEQIGNREVGKGINWYSIEIS